jgi:hypothetical protein
MGVPSCVDVRCACTRALALELQGSCAEYNLTMCRSCVHAQPMYHVTHKLCLPGRHAPKVSRNMCSQRLSLVAIYAIYMRSLAQDRFKSGQTLVTILCHEVHCRHVHTEVSFLSLELCLVESRGLSNYCAYVR